MKNRGGSRPVQRKDDLRLKKEDGKAKLYSIRVTVEDELKAVKKLTPHERALACLLYSKIQGGLTLDQILGTQMPV